MVNLIVVDNPKRWPLHTPGVPVVAARSYLAQPQYSEERNLRVFNLCKSYRYQSTGYYVSLLAMARGHKPLPSITTIQDMKTLSIARVVASDLDELVERSLKPLRSESFTLSIYFGRNLAKRYDELSSRLFRLFPAPLLRAEFRCEDSSWELRGLGPIPASDIPEAHQGFVAEAANSFFAQNRLPPRPRNVVQYDLAILHNPQEKYAPSNKGALKKLAAAAKRMQMSVSFIEREDFGRLGEFDALFIRETTAVHHHTYRFARRAAAEGLVVIDDPESIVKCSNKVYLAELLNRANLPSPRTLVVHKENWEQVPSVIGLPCVLKQPDGSFSRGVQKVGSAEELEAAITPLLERSDLVIAQQFLPTEYDWRIGVLDREPLYACQYYMVKRHWQISQCEENGTRYGDVRAVPLAEVPPVVLNAAVRSTRLIGDGLYGVDIKQVGDKAYVIEINDNPNLDAGYEDSLLGDALYDRILGVFRARLQKKRNGMGAGPGPGQGQAQTPPPG